MPVGKWHHDQNDRTRAGDGALTDCIRREPVGYTTHRWVGSQARVPWNAHTHGWADQGADVDAGFRHYAGCRLTPARRAAPLPLWGPAWRRAASSAVMRDLPMPGSPVIST